MEIQPVISISNIEGGEMCEWMLEKGHLGDRAEQADALLAFMQEMDGLTLDVDVLGGMSNTDIVESTICMCGLQSDTATLLEDRLSDIKKTFKLGGGVTSHFLDDIKPMTPSAYVGYVQNVEPYRVSIRGFSTNSDYKLIPNLTLSTELERDMVIGFPKQDDPIASSTPCLIGRAKRVAAATTGEVLVLGVQDLVLIALLIQNEAVSSIHVVEGDLNLIRLCKEAFAGKLDKVEFTDTDAFEFVGDPENSEFIESMDRVILYQGISTPNAANYDITLVNLCRSRGFDVTFIVSEITEAHLHIALEYLIWHGIIAEHGEGLLPEAAHLRQLTEVLLMDRVPLCALLSTMYTDKFLDLEDAFSILDYDNFHKRITYG